MQTKPRRIILIHKRAPGDTAVLTALPRDIHAAYPGQFELGVDTNCMSLWHNNPHVVPAKELLANGPAERIKLTYGKGLRDQNFETVHFLAYFHRDFEVQARVRVPLTLPYPDLHLSDVEKTVPLVNGRYWVFLSGGKSDFTAKVWATTKWQETVDRMVALGLPCVQIGDTAKGHWHPDIKNCLNLVGKTDLRDYLRLIYHADGVICGVTSAMHLAAGLQRPCVCIAGGREAYWWEAYVRENKGLGGLETAAKLKVPHRFLHTIGLLDCCKLHGCWLNKAAPLHQDRSVCKMPVMHPGQPVPKCLDLTTVDHVLTAVMSYYLDGTLKPPPDTPVAAEVEKVLALSAAETA
jgi:ADP-heptose:LPS heptosyltransferase